MRARYLNARVIKCGTQLFLSSGKCVCVRLLLFHFRFPQMNADRLFTITAACAKKRDGADGDSQGKYKSNAMETNTFWAIFTR